MFHELDFCDDRHSNNVNLRYAQVYLLHRAIYTIKTTSCHSVCYVIRDMVTMSG